MINKEFLKGLIKPLILKVLQDNTKMYGYEITQQVEKLTLGKIKLSYGGLYPILHSLEAEGILLTETVNVDNRIRKYYFLTKEGNKTANERILELQEFVSLIQTVLNPKLAVQ
jgi:PadR family transcriptional regulator, regulatory protein PadR